MSPVPVGGLVLRNPVLVASGPFGYGGRYLELWDVAQLGAVVVKGTSPEPWPGNPPPRIAEVEGGLLNAVGLENPGVEAALAGPLPLLQRLGATVVLNVVGRDQDDFVHVARRAQDSPCVHALELNVSCPNVPHGLRFGTDPGALGRLVEAVRRVTSRPVWVKLPPAAPSVRDLARAAREAGADALCLTNTLPGVSLDRRGRSRLGSRSGGLSGPALRSAALLAVWEGALAGELPVVGMGGIEGVEDAQAFLDAGARAVAVGSALLYRPMLPMELVQAWEEGRLAYRPSSPLSLGR